MLKKLLSLIAYCLLPIAAFAQNYTAISASNIADLNGNKLAAGQIYFTGTDQYDAPLNFQVGGGGTILKRPFLEDSRVLLTKWMLAMWMLANCKNGVSSWEIHRAIGVTQKSAWFMLHRIRLGLQEQGGGKLGGPGSKVEVDETFIGGKARNTHRSRRARVKASGRYTAKTVVMGLLERGGKVRTQVLGSDRKQPVMHEIIRDNVATGRG